MVAIGRRARRLLRRTVTTPVKIHPLERFVARRTAGRSLESRWARTVPLWTDYPNPSIRKIERDGLTLELDISDICQWSVYFGFFDPSHAAFARHCEIGATVLDLGANIGLTALLASKLVGPTGRVVAVEPYPSNFRLLTENIARNGARNTRAINRAIASKRGVVTMASGPQGNRTNAKVTDDGYELPAETIDSLVEELAITSLDLVKLDIEGYEMKALEGALETLRAQRPSIFIELSDDQLVENGTSASEVVGFLQDLGYSVAEATKGSPIDARALRGCHFDAIATAI